MNTYVYGASDNASMSSDQDGKSGKGLNIKEQQQQEAKQQAAANQAPKVPELSAEMVKDDQGGSSSSGSLLDEIMAMGNEDANELKPKPLSGKERAARRRRGDIPLIPVSSVFGTFESPAGADIRRAEKKNREYEEAEKRKALKAGKTTYGPKPVKLKPAKPVKGKKAAKKQGKPVEQRPVKQDKMNGFSPSDAVANDDGSVGQFDKVVLDSVARAPQAIVNPEGYNQVERQRMQPVGQDALERELFEQYNPTEEMEIVLPNEGENEEVADDDLWEMEDEITQPLPGKGGTLDSLKGEFDTCEQVPVETYERNFSVSDLFNVYVALAPMNDACSFCAETDYSTEQVPVDVYEESFSLPDLLSDFVALASADDWACEEDEAALLRHENERLRMEIDVLKRAVLMLDGAGLHERSRQSDSSPAAQWDDPEDHGDYYIDDDWDDDWECRPLSEGYHRRNGANFYVDDYGTEHRLNSFGMWYDENNSCWMD